MVLTKILSSYEWLQERIAEKQTLVDEIEAKIEETKEKISFRLINYKNIFLVLSVAGKNVGYVPEKLDKNKNRTHFLENKKLLLSRLMLFWRVFYTDKTV